MPERYRVRVEKDACVFSAGHFITFAGNICERLHGHNYRVGAEVDGPLDENSYVVDFLFLRDALVEIVGSLDHRVLLPTQHPTIRVTAGERAVEAVFEDRRWVFPREDCALLPIANTTAELLARHIGLALLKRLESVAGMRPQRLRIDVEENVGQWATWEWEPQEGPGRRGHDESAGSSAQTV